MKNKANTMDSSSKRAPAPVTEFMKRHYKHFNSAVVVDASEAYAKHLAKGGKMLVAMAGAMSTAELGKSLAEMIRQGKVHAISCTGANLEEDVFNLVAHNHYERVPDYRFLTPAQEKELFDRHLNRVTDTCIPEEEAMRRIEHKILKLWMKADAAGESKLPHEFLYELLNSGALKEHYQIDPADSWLLAAAEKNLPIFVPGWEDSTLGNIFVSNHVTGNIKNLNTMKGGLYYMQELIKWYCAESARSSIGFYQIGGGIAGDFPICVVPLILQDLQQKIPFWGYFCQISDSTTSYGSYSGAHPNEKITWGKLDAGTPRFIIESDATIVAPLMFAYLLGW
ncbi:MAG: deoxyhypusine synthase family protein [Candidatus Micrarchaeia archaeon]